MIKVNKSINLKQLDSELNNLGLIATLDDNGQITEVGLAENNTSTEAELQAAIAAHIAVNEGAEKTTAKAALLAQLGITAEQAKLLLS